MCVGGSSPKPISIKGGAFTKQFSKKATITGPKRKELRSLNRTVGRQRAFVASQMARGSSMNRAQAALDAAQRALQMKLVGIEYFAKRQAESKAVRQRQALLLATLQGPPPPEPAAAPPRLGGQGDPVDWSETGRHALTIPAGGPSGLAI